MSKTTTNTTGNRGAVSRPKDYEGEKKYIKDKIANYQKQLNELELKHAAEAKKQGMIEALKEKGFSDEEIAGFTKLG